MGERTMAAEGRTSWLTLLGLGIGSAVAGFWLVVGLGRLLDAEVTTTRSMILIVLSLDAAMNAGLAWWRRRLGGWLLITSGIAMIAMTLFVPSVEDEPMPSLLNGGVPLLLSGLFLVLAERGKAQGVSAD